MNITRNNYEEFFMLYADDELAAAQRKEVEAFVAANPDLKKELELFGQFKLSPDTDMVFANKEMLMKTGAGKPGISADNYESFFVLYADNELAEDEKAGVEDFVYHHPQYQAAFELIQQVKLSADTGIVFKNKETLYRKEKDERVVPFIWWRMAAAAAVLLLLGIFWLNQSDQAVDVGVAVKNNPAVTIPQQPTLQNKGTSVDTNSNRQPGVETAVVAEEKKDLQIKPIAPDNAIARSVKAVKKEDKQASNDLPEVQGSSAAEDVAAGSKLKAVTIASVKEPDPKVEINTGKTAAANKSVKDQQLVYTDSGESDNIQAEQAVATNDDDNLEVLNTSVNTKNSLRGFLRKASRAIARKTSAGDGDNTGKSILIGGFEIAVR